MNRWGIFLLVGAVAPFVATAQDWPQFRGPGGQGHSDVRSLPLHWNGDSDNITWKTPIEGLGWSSPVVIDEHIWLTTATDDGRSLRAVCLNLKTGREVRQVEVFKVARPGKIHRKNSHASPTPVIDGDRIYVHFGSNGTACLTSEGEIVWRQTIKYNYVHGSGGSPVVVDDLLVVSCDGGDAQFVVALDKATGRERWRTPRPKSTYQKKFAFSTPLVIDEGGTRQLISAGANNVCGYDPKDGKQIWNVTYTGGYSVVPRPVYGHGLIFLSTCYDSPELLAIRTGGRGDVSESHVAWRLRRGAPHNPSPLLIGDELYVVSDRGIASCLDAKTGEVHWQHRLDGSFSASPLYAAGRIYFLDEEGTTTVVAPGKEYRELASNTVDGRTLASLAPVEGALLLRTDTHLYRIEAE